MQHRFKPKFKAAFIDTNFIHDSCYKYNGCKITKKAKLSFEATSIPYSYGSYKAKCTAIICMISNVSVSLHVDMLN